jgi:hypothetical protein
VTNEEFRALIKEAIEILNELGETYEDMEDEDQHDSKSIATTVVTQGKTILPIDKGIAGLPLNEDIAARWKSGDFLYRRRKIPIY